MKSWLPLVAKTNSPSNFFIAVMERFFFSVERQRAKSLKPGFFFPLKTFSRRTCFVCECVCVCVFFRCVLFVQIPRALCLSVSLPVSTLSKKKKRCHLRNK